ncbi:MAG TPA: hypothetical protein VMS76_08310, partial [Planctomycetota bacterium]|nr:hypothetical protein [Planctomycetota bacterium]
RRSDEIEVEVFDFSPERIEEVRVKLREVLEGAGGADEEEAGDGDVQGRPSGASAAEYGRRTPRTDRPQTADPPAEFR